MRIFTIFLLSIFFINGFSQSPGCPLITPTGTTICQGQCGALTATAVTNRATTSYSVSSIAYAPFAYTGGTAVSAGTDDVWSPIVNLPFNFCFFGNTYNKVVLGSNGVLTFDLTEAGTGSGYVLSTALPSTANSPIPANSIAALCRDIDPSLGGTIKYYITGSAPCRALVFYFSGVPDYDCSWNHTFQLVLYENTNFIDVYVQSSQSCSGWNSGYGIIGIQNIGASTAICPPSRNRTAFSATNEGWRFTPTGAPSYTVTWKAPGNVTVGTGLGPISVCPTVNTTYTASMVITNCDGAQTTYTNTALVTVNNSPTVTIAPTATLNCIGNTPITTTVTPASTYSWSGPGIVAGGSTGTASVNLSGVYTVSATAAGCTRTATISMVSPPPITVTVNSASICAGVTAVLTATGASTYTWNPGALTGSSISVTPTVNTTYTVIGRSATGCTASAVSTVSINPKPSATLSFTNPTCDNNNGIIKINNTSPVGQTVTSFTSNLGSVSGQTITGLGASSPIITLTNNFGCTFTVSATLTMTPGPTAITTSFTNATCGLSNGIITFTTPTGGTAPFTYSVNNVSSTSPTSSLSAGTHSVLVKDFNGCIFTKTITITNIAGPTAVAGNTAQASCNTNNGSFTVTGVTGGTATYSFAVDAAALTTSSVTGGLSAGTHTVFVKDANGCLFNRTFTIPTANGPSSFTVNTTNSNCGLANGTSTVTSVTGGSPTYSFSFDGGAFATTTTTTGLMSGTHTMTVKDANSCTITATYSVGNNAPPTASVTNSINILCNGGSTGSFTTTPVGNAPFTYTLTSPVQTNTTGVFTGLVANTYSVIVKDNFGCTVSTSVTLTQPTQVTATVSSIPVNCFGNSTGTVSAGAAGGVGPYTYLWPALGSSTLATVGGAAAGTYTVTIKDANLCTITKTVTVTQPTSLTLTSTLTPATCGNANGSGTVTIAGGTTTYNYNWSNGGLTNVLTSASEGTYTLTVQDFNGCILTRTVAVTNIPGPTAITGTTTLASCNTNNGTYNITGVTGGTPGYTYSVDAVGTTSLTTGLSAGTHTILVRDINGCIFSTTFTINTANGPSSFTVNTTNSNCNLANGTSTITGVTGGTPTYSFSFDGGAFATTTTTSGLMAGTHTLTVKDVNSCTITATYSVGNNAPPTASVTNSINILCNGESNGSFTTTPVGNAPFTYTLTSPVQTNTTGVFTGLVANTYSVIVKDNFGCTVSTSVTLTQPTQVTATVSSIPVNCFGNSTGTVSAGAAGGVGPYTYLWPALGSSALATVGGAAAGTYTVTIKDANLCTITKTVTVTQPTSLTLTSTLTPATCGNANGSGTVTIAGGTTTYNYNWSNGGLTNVLTSASEGTYTLTVQDFNGCVLTRTVAVTNIPGPTAITGTTTLAGCGLLNGTHNVTGVTGGTSAYTFSVDGVSTGSLTSGLSAGTHSILVSDFNGCIFSTTFNINTANGPTSATIITTNATCGAANGTSTITGVTGGVAPYQYSFDGGAFGAGITTSSLSAGTHSVIIKDVNSCTLAVTYEELNNSGPTISVTSSLNILCNGASTGSLEVTPVGGASPFTYTLTAPTQTNSTGSFTGLQAGTYNITIKDNSGCTATASVTLTQPTAITLTVTSLPASCFGSATGTVSASGDGGVGPYTYLWPALGASTLSTINNVIAGTYSVTQTDFNGCPITQSITVTQPTSLTLTSTLTPATCGNANGSGTVTVAGGTPAYTYNWSNGGIISTLSGASEGTHTLIVTDFNGCALTRTVNVTNIPGPTAITGTTTLAGCNLNNGSYNVTGVTGGTPAYSYSVDAVSTVSLTSGLSAGTHTVTVGDFNGCLFNTTFNINTANGPTSATILTSNSSCGNANGSATVTAITGGLSPYEYSFNGGAFSSSVSTSDLIAGPYSVTIKDVNSCVLAVTFTVLNTSGPSASVTDTIHVNCFNGSTGSFTVTPVGGTSPFTYTLTSPVLSNGTGVFTGLPAGSYNITVNDNLGCTTTTSVTIIQPTAVTITVTSLPADCFGASTGTVSADGAGGVGPYTYLWPALGASTLSSVVNVAAGTYSVTQTDFNGCSITQSITVTQPTSLTLTSTLTPATCSNANGSGTVTVAGGTPAYTYNWSNGGITNTLSGASEGTYTLNITDFNACVLTITLTVTNIPGPTAITGTTTLAGCGLLNGTYNVTGVTGGTSAYTYSVDAIATGSLTGGLGAGTHTVTVSDFNECLYSTTFNIGTTTGPATATITSSNASCGSANGTSTVTSIAGGLSPYQYSFNEGAFVVGATTTGLIAGTHTVTIKDANSCTLTVTYDVLNNGNPSASIISSTNTSCFAGSNGGFTISGSAGSGAPYSYTLTTPFQSNGLGIFTGLTAGTYSIITQDNAGCTVNTTVTIAEPTAVTLTPSSIPAKCFASSTGTINIAGAGGTSPYQYSLNGGAYQSSNSYTAVGANIYNISIQDFNSCISTQTLEVTQPATLAIQVATQNANCTAANGIATTTVTGGTPIYTYTWTGGGGASAISNSVVAGTYTVIATDANGCTVSGQAVIGLTPGGAATITALSNITCNGANDGSMTASMIGGSAPFTYSWSPGGQVVSTAVGLNPTSYTCEITDFYGCKAYASETLAQPSVLTAIMNSNNVKCYGTATGTVSAAGTGGIAPYTYMWPTIPSTLSTVPDVAIGIYTCNITDANGCSISPTITVTQPTSITLTSTVTAANCGQANGSATVIAAGGAPGAYTYSWSAGSNPNSPNQGSLLAGTYTIIVQDANNCTEVVSATIPNTAGPSISVTSQTNVSCFGGCNGIATTSVSGGVGTYIYSWSNGNVSAIAPNLCAQIYTVSVTDGAGCVASTSVNITEPTALTVGIVSTDPKCYGATNGFGVAAALGGTPDYTYTWTGLGGNTATSNPIGAGNYGLSVTDGNGCIVTSSMALVNPPAMSAGITSTNVTCFEACNGIATATSTNGIGVVDYFWVGGASPITGQTANGLCMATYTMIATDQNNCTASAIISITEPPVLTASISLTGSVTCNGGNNGFAIVDPAGGTPTYSYSWSGSAAINGNSTNANTLLAGIYTVTVTDTKGCSATANTTVFEPTPLSTTLTTTNAKCNGVCDGSANITFEGGTGTTTFLWQPGLQSGNFVNNLCAGDQTVTITSNGSCSTVLTFTLTEPVLLTAVASATNSNCSQNNGKACAVVTGGTSPLNYLWSNTVNTLCNNNILAGAYTFTVTDANGCIAITSGLVNDVAGPIVSVISQTNVNCFNEMNGAAISTISGGVPNYTISWSGNQASANTTTNPINFGVGLHNITVVDAAGCIGTASVDIQQPMQLVSAIGSYTDVTCYGLSNGGATMLTNGGTIPYSYAWTLSTQTNSLLINVGANTYIGTVTDNNGCTTTSSVIIRQPQALVFNTPIVTDISCAGANNGQISTGAINGSPGYTYLWNPAQPGNSGTIGNLAQGGYSLTVTDQNNCSINTIFSISEPQPLMSSYTSLPATCNLPNGSATVTVSGGSPTYTLNWNTSPAQQGLIINNMASGNNWQAVITDSKGCSITQTVSIANPTPPKFVTPVVKWPTCYGSSNGEITVNYVDGFAPYTVSWLSPISQTFTAISALTQSIAGVAHGDYTVVLTDSYGCSTYQGINMPNPQFLSLFTDPDKSICYGQTTQLNATGQGGTPGYSYTWSPNPFTTGGPHTVNPTITTVYTVSVSDTKGCSPSPKIIMVNVSPQLSISGYSVTKCDGDNETLTPNILSPGRGAPYDFSWSTGATFTNVATSSINVTANYLTNPNTYTVLISDGCTIPGSSAIFTVNVNPLPIIDFAAVLPGCAPLSVTLTGISDGSSDLFNWSDDRNGKLGTGNPLPVMFSDSGKYTITLNVINPATNCSNTITKADYIEVYPQPIAAFYADPQTTSILDPNINYINTSQGATSYYWDFGDINAINGSNNTTVINPSHYYNVVGIYTTHLLATSIKGCKDTARLNVEITPDFALYIPNAFTPDGNKLNDTFQPMGVGIDEENYRMDIFDRWGENIFTSNSFRKGWDGTVKGGSKLAPQGVYIYKLMVYDLQGNKHPFVGHVTVIRKEE